tara:strand:- start:246867 stop:247400 length:534 start_codon:yes stop_codon:yes gene_type:complete
MGNPATLTDIDGIGPATATKLEAAGIKTVADLAAAEAATLEALDGMPPGAKFADWIAAAQPAAKAAKAVAADEIAAGPMIVVTGPKKGFRRAGFGFGRQPRAIPLQEFGEGIEALRRVLAILSEDRLTTVCIDLDGAEHKPDRNAVQDLAALAAAGGNREVDPEDLRALVARVFGSF